MMAILVLIKRQITVQNVSTEVRVFLTAIFLKITRCPSDELQLSHCVFQVSTNESVAYHLQTFTLLIPFNHTLTTGTK